MVAEVADGGRAVRGRSGESARACPPDVWAGGGGRGGAFSCGLCAVFYGGVCNGIPCLQNLDTDPNTPFLLCHHPDATLTSPSTRARALLAYWADRPLLSMVCVGSSLGMCGFESGHVITSFFLRIG